MKKINITPNDGMHYFFGYYDLQPYDKTYQKHLTHRVSFTGRNPEQGEIAELGYIDLATNTFICLATTCAWNFQQGAMLQWFEDGESIIFNDYDGEKYISRVVGLDGKEIKRFCMPIATLSPDRKKALSINFARIYDFRSGYGYLNKKDLFFEEKAPVNDGIFLLDLEKNQAKLIVNYAEMKKGFEEEPFTSQKLVVNHINFNPSANGYVMLFRNMEGSKWGTVLAVGDLKGNFKKLTNFEVNSHYSWKDDETLMIYSGLPEWGVYFINVESGERARLYDPLCDAGDIHCNYSPDRSCFIGDGYPDKNNERSLYLYDFATQSSKILLSVHSEPPTVVDARCDLHARWRQDGKEISYDSTENKRREIFRLLVD